MLELNIENVVALQSKGFTCATVNEHNCIVKAYKIWESASNNINPLKLIRAVPFAPFLSQNK